MYERQDVIADPDEAMGNSCLDATSVRGGGHPVTPSDTRRLPIGRICMNRLLVLLPLSVFLPGVVNAAPQEPARNTTDYVLEGVFDRGPQALQSGDWTISDDPAADDAKFIATTSSRDEKALLTMQCDPNGEIGIGAFWFNPLDLGDHFAIFDLQPTTLNWKKPDLTQNQEWISLSLPPLIAAIALQTEDEENFLAEVVRHEELELVVERGPDAGTTSATFPIRGAPVRELQDTCNMATEPQRETRMVFPHLALGGPSSLSGEMLLLVSNRSEEEWTGRVDVLDSDGENWSRQLSVNGNDITRQNGSFTFRLQGRGSASFSVESDEPVLQTGFLTLTAPNDTVSAALFFRMIGNGELVETVGVNAADAGTEFIIPASDGSGFSTGIAWASFDEDRIITLSALDDQGNLLWMTSYLESGHSSFLIRERIDLPPEFSGTIRIVSDGEVYVLAMRIDNFDGGFHLTSVPVTPVQ